jgi:hypothetical protein
MYLHFISRIRYKKTYCNIPHNSVTFHLLELLYIYYIVFVNSVLSQQKCRVHSRSREYLVLFSSEPANFQKHLLGVIEGMC